MKTLRNHPPARCAVRHSRQLFALTGVTCLLALLFSIAMPAFGAGRDIGGKRDFKIFTQNLYVGTEFERILAVDPADPSFPTNLLMAVTQTYYELLASDPAARMGAVAAQIASELPEAVALQEATLVRRQSPGDAVIGNPTPAEEVVVDYLELVLGALRQLGAHYRVVVVSPELDVEMPMINLQTGTIDDARLTDREAILVRADLPPGHLRIRNPQTGNFKTNLLILPVGLEVTRGWCSVDVFTRGRSFRLINAHLEEETQPAIQGQQAQEILEGPAKTRLPIFLVGDFNSDANHVMSTPTYDLLLAGGLTDSWNVVHPGQIGLTWGHDPLLADPTVAFIWRLDLILYRGPRIIPTEVTIHDLVLGRTAPPLWASDHAGVVAEFRLR